MIQKRTGNFPGQHTRHKYAHPIYPQVCKFLYLAVHLRVLVDICCRNLNQLRTVATTNNTSIYLIKHSAFNKAFSSYCALLFCYKVSTTFHLQLCLEYYYQYGKAHADSHSIRQAQKECGQKRHYPHTLEVTNNRIRSNMENKAIQYCAHSFDLHSPVCSFSISNRDQRAAGACSSD